MYNWQNKIQKDTHIVCLINIDVLISIRLQTKFVYKQINFFGTKYFFLVLYWDKLEK